MYLDRILYNFIFSFGSIYYPINIFYFYNRRLEMSYFSIGIVYEYLYSCNGCANNNFVNRFIYHDNIF